LRIAALGTVLAIAQGIALSVLTKKNEQSIVSEKDITAKYEQFTKKLPSLQKSEEAAREVLKYRAQSGASFMPTGVYYALADSLLPGMSLKEAHLVKQANKETIYNLNLIVGCDSANLGYRDFVETFIKNMQTYYKGLLTAKLKSASQGKTTTIGDSILSEQKLDLELAVITKSAVQNKGTSK